MSQDKNDSRDDLVARARDYGRNAHVRINQRRKYTLDPYEVHLKEVAELVASVTTDPEMIAAAWLHDAVEDTPTTFDDIEQTFGPGVMQLVMELTDVSRPSDGNRARRKAIDLEHTALASPRAKTIKLADIIDNSLDICRHDPRFGRIYLAEMSALMKVLKEGDKRLYVRAQETLDTCTGRLGIDGKDVPDSSPPIEYTLEGKKAFLTQYRSIRFFMQSFTAKDILEPLTCFDLGIPAEGLVDRNLWQEAPVTGLRREGSFVRYLLREEMEKGDLSGHSISTHQVVSNDSPLTDVIHALGQFSYVFVEVDGDTPGVITRADMEKPVARMWLFGLIMLLESAIMQVIKELSGDEAWTRLVSESRLQKARLLQEERARRKLPADLQDCLQFSDKLEIVICRPDFVKKAGFQSMAAAKRVVKELESLRNDLAHGQPVGMHDWPAVVRMSRQINYLLNA